MSFPPSIFLEQYMEAFHYFMPYDPSSKEYKSMVTVTFIDQSSKDMKKLQKLEGLQDKSPRELGQVAEKLYDNRETE